MKHQAQTTTSEKFNLVPGRHAIGTISDIHALERITALIMTAMTVSRYGIPFHVACTSPASYKLFRRALGGDLVTRLNTRSPAAVEKEIADLFTGINGENTLLLLDAEISTYEMLLEDSDIFACGILSAIVPILPNKCSKQAASDIQKMFPPIKTLFFTLGAQNDEEQNSFAMREWSEHSDFNSVWDYNGIPDHVVPFVIRPDESADLPPLTEFRSFLSTTENTNLAKRDYIEEVLAYLDAGCDPVTQHLLKGIMMPCSWSLY